MPKLELTKKEMEALEFFVEVHLAFPAEFHLVDGYCDNLPHIKRVAVKLGVMAPDELEEEGRGNA